MPIILECTLLWIPASCGGRSRPPVAGLRPIIFFQRERSVHPRISWSIEVVDLGTSDIGTVGSAKLRFFKHSVPDPKFVKPGEHFELLDGFRAIAVGTIERVVEG